MTFSLIKAGWDLLQRTPIPQGIRPSLWWLVKGSPLYWRLATLFVITIAAILGTVVWLNLADTNRILVSALDSPWENTQLSHTGIESFLLSSIVGSESEPDVQSKVNGNFTAILGKLQANLSAFPPKQVTQATIADSNTMSQMPATADIEILDSPSRGSDLGSKFLITDRQPGFLLVPGVAAVHPDNLYAKKREAEVTLTKEEEPRLYIDILMSQSIASILCGDLQTYNQSEPPTSIFMATTAPPALSPHFSQAYVIFQSGVARECESTAKTGWKEQRAYYQEQFTASTLLQDRSYFRETLADKEVVQDVKSDTDFLRLFHKTEPYIDLGGNGVVETFCRSLLLKSASSDVGSVQESGPVKMQLRPYQSDAILCLDFRLQSNIENSLVSKINRFGGTAEPFTCDSSSGCHPEQSEGTTAGTSFSDLLLSRFYPASKFTDEDKQTLSDRYIELARNNEKSQITGRILVQQKMPLTAVIFTVPLGRSRILAGKLDLHSYQRLSSFWISAFSITAGCGLLLVILILVDYGLKVKEQERAFEAVDTVMSDVPAPYARLDENGHFAKVNNAFAVGMGFESAETALASLRGVQFDALLADEQSRTEYQTVREERRIGKAYRSYRITLWAGGGPAKYPVKKFEVHGWDVPTPRASREKPGSSFGILMPV